MGIKNKRKGPAPNVQERWQLLARRASSPQSLIDAVREYRSSYPNASLPEATRIVRDYQRRFS